MHISSYMLSILLHVLLVLVTWLWPTSPPLQLDKPMMQISLTMGAPGGDRLPSSSVLGPQGQPSPRDASTKPAPAAGSKQQIAGEVAALPDETRPERLEARNEARPESQTQEKPVPLESNPAPKPEPAPVPKPPDVALTSPQRKPEEKKPDTKPEPDPKPEVKSPPKPTPPKPTPPKPTPPKAPTAKEIMDKALADAKDKAGPQTPTRKGNASTSVAGALASAERTVRSSGAGGGGGGEGTGPGGGGIYDIYAGLVILAVRPNWSMPTYSRDMLIAQVRVRMDPAGNVLSASLERGSGRADFDASCVNAVLRTKILPPPPTPDQAEIVIGFNSLEMSGR